MARPPRWSFLELFIASGRGEIAGKPFSKTMPLLDRYVEPLTGYVMPAAWWAVITISSSKHPMQTPIRVCGNCEMHIFMNDEHWMKQALELARKAEAAGEVPVGAVIVLNNELVAEGWNRPISTSDPTAHAEIVALRAAGEKLDNYRLLDAELYVTLEPCPMCVGAMLHARVKRVIYAATDPKTGALGGTYDLLNKVSHNHSFEVTKGVLEEQSRTMLQNFFRGRR